MRKSLLSLLSFIVIVSLVSCSTNRNVLEIDKYEAESSLNSDKDDTKPIKNSQLSGKKGYDSMSKGSNINGKKKSGDQ
jgi:hypothetical protein